MWGVDGGLVCGGVLCGGGDAVVGVRDGGVVTN